MQHAHGTMSIHYCSATHHQIGGISRFFIKISFYSSFINNRFSGQIGFVHLQRNSFQQLSISGNFFTCFQNDDITYHYVFTRDFLYASVSDHFYQGFFIDCIQQIELLAGIIFEEETDSGSQ